jgi:hypothetical protein
VGDRRGDGARPQTPSADGRPWRGWDGAKVTLPGSICDARRAGAALAWLHVARHREHAERDVASALAACREAAAVAERARLWDRPMLAVESDLTRRMARLRRKSFARRTLGRAA